MVNKNGREGDKQRVRIEGGRKEREKRQQGKNIKDNQLAKKH